MHFALPLLSLAILTIALPLPNPTTNSLAAKREDGDDAVVYAWSVDGAKTKSKREAEDGDDAVVYAWSVDTGKIKREAEDGDDAVVYSWSVDAAGKA